MGKTLHIEKRKWTKICSFGAVFFILCNNSCINTNFDALLSLTHSNGVMWQDLRLVGLFMAEMWSIFKISRNFSQKTHFAAKIYIWTLSQKVTPSENMRLGHIYQMKPRNLIMQGVPTEFLFWLNSPRTNIIYWILFW